MSATLTGYIKRMESVTKADQEVTDLWIGAKSAEFGMKMTDWDSLVAEFAVDDHVTVVYDEKEGTYRGKPITYRNLKSIQAAGQAPQAAPPSDDSPFPPEPRQKPQETAPATKDSPKATGPKQEAPAPSRNGWTEAYSQSREAHDSSRESIEAQVALKAAVDLLRDMLTTEEGGVEAKLELVKKNLPELTMVARAAIREARGG